MDVVDKLARSRMMSGIKSKNTIIEMITRRELHKRGFRYRLHSRKITGKPDLVLVKYKVLVFINGCFWHGHTCRLFKYPKTNADFWFQKIEGNKKRDAENLKILQDQGWRILLIWECAIKRITSEETSRIFDRISVWIRDSISIPFYEVLLEAKNEKPGS